MNEIDQRILLAIERLKQLETIRFDTDFCNAIGIKKQNLINIKSNKNCSFTVEQIKKIREVYNISLNYIFGFSDEIFIK